MDAWVDELMHLNDRNRLTPTFASSSQIVVVDVTLVTRPADVLGSAEASPCHEVARVIQRAVVITSALCLRLKVGVVIIIIININNYYKILLLFVKR